jgi:hypothetical protein
MSPVDQIPPVPLVEPIVPDHPRYIRGNKRVEVSYSVAADFGQRTGPSGYHRTPRGHGLNQRQSKALKQRWNNHEASFGIQE